MDRIKGWETKAMRRLFRFERKEDETLRMMDKDGDGDRNELEKDEEPLFYRKCLSKVCGEPWSGHARRTTCGVDDTEILRCMEEYGVVAKYKGNAYEG